MSKHSFPFYAEQLEMILAVTKMLNEHSGKVPIDSDYYFRVQLVEAHEDTVIGEWSDEVGPDCWEFSLTDKNAKMPVTQVQMMMHNGVPGARGTEGSNPVDEAKITRIAKAYAANRNVQLD